MLSFLKLCKPLDEAEVWKQYVSKASDEKRAKLLRVRPLRERSLLREARTERLLSLDQAIVLSTTLRR